MILMDDIIREGHPTLRTKAEEVKFPLSEETRKLAEDMLQYLKKTAKILKLRKNIIYVVASVLQPIK